MAIDEGNPKDEYSDPEDYIDDVSDSGKKRLNFFENFKIFKYIFK